MTFGGERVRTQFNPSKMSLVDRIKQDTAHLIDTCNQNTLAPPEEQRLWAIAMTKYEEACMWAVKAATWVPSKPDPAVKEYPPDHPVPGDLGSVSL